MIKLCFKLIRTKVDWKEILVEGNIEQARLDKFLEKNLGIPFSLAQKIIRQKKIQILTPNSEASIKHDSNYKLQINDKIRIPSHFCKQTTENELQKETPLKIDQKKITLIKNMRIFEDDNFLILNKQGNISTQGGSQESKNLLDILKHYYGKPGQVSIIHRLDKNTSGVLFLGKNKNATRKLSMILNEQKNIKKYYLGILKGVPTCFLKNRQDSGIIDAPLTFNTNKNRTVVSNFAEESSKNSKTYFKILGFIDFAGSDNKVRGFSISDITENMTANTENLNMSTENRNGVAGVSENSKRITDFFADPKKVLSLVKFRIVGGRKHQIRAHSSSILKAPVLFDGKYGFDWGQDLHFYKWFENKIDRGEFEKKEEEVKEAEEEREEREEIEEEMEEGRKDRVLINGAQLEGGQTTDKRYMLKREIRNYKKREVLGLHALETIIKCGENIDDFQGFLEEQGVEGKISVSAELPAFFQELMGKAFLGERKKEMMEKIYELF